MRVNDLILAGDIGGTKTNLALYERSDFPGNPLREQRYINDQVTGFSELIATFLAEGREKPEVACFGVAGPIGNGWVQMTNLDWRIDVQELSQLLPTKDIFLINDLVATAMGTPLLSKKELFIINAGKTQPKGNIAVIAPGTGLGEAFLLQGDNGFIPVASEGGHADFAPRDRLQLELLDFLWHRDKHVSVEKVCSGTGLPNIYDFLASSSRVPEDFARELAGEEDRTPMLVKSALTTFASGDMEHVAVRSLQLFLDILAAEAANVSLKLLATGGIYIGGGIPPRILPFFEPDRFMAVFARGVYREMLSEIPIYVLRNTRTALLGAAAYAIRRTKKPDKRETGGPAADK